MFEKNIVTAPAKENLAQICKAAKLAPKIVEGLDLAALKKKLEIPENATPEQISSITTRSGLEGILNIFEAICENNSDALFEFLAVCFYSTKEEVETADTMTLILPVFQLIKSKEVISFFTSLSELGKTNFEN